MKISRRETITLAVLISIPLVFTFYTTSAYYVASHIFELEGRGYVWPHMPTGSLVPWPTYSEFGYQVIMDVNETDLWYFNNIIKSNVLILITIILWIVISIVVSWRIWKLWKQNKVT